MTAGQPYTRRRSHGGWNERSSSRINAYSGTRGSGSVSGQGTGKRQFETRIAEWVVAYRWRVILAALFLVAVASSGILRLGFSGDYRIFFDEDNPQLLALEALRTPTARTKTSCS